MNRSLRPILLVEDNAHDAELTITAFREAGLANEVHLMQDGAQALDFLMQRKVRPIVILLDLKMPKIDGREVLRRIKEDADLRTIPVVVLTSSREESDLLQSYELGANAFVVKPVDFREFLETVARVGCFWSVVNEPLPATRHAQGAEILK